MTAYWRVKSWKVDYGSFTFETDFGTEEFNLGAAPLALAAPAEGIDSEKRLVCSPDREFSYEQPPGGGSSPFCLFRLFADARSDGENIKLATEILLGPSLSGVRYLSNVGSGASVGTATLDVAGEQVVFPMFANSLADVAALNFKISAAEYWPYDPGDGGGPIYDAETGAQLRAF